MNTFTALLIAPDGHRHGSASERIRRLGGEVYDSLPSAAAVEVDSDLIVLDLTGEGDIDQGLLQLLIDDPRPLVALAPRLCAGVRQLANRGAGIMLMSGSEDDSGYRVALSICRGLATLGPRPGPPAHRRAPLFSGLVPDAAALGA